MFDKLKQKFVKQAKSEAVQEIRRSSNEGRIRTVSAVVEGIIFVGLIIMSAKGGGGAIRAAPGLKSGTTIIIQNSTIMLGK